MPFLSHDPIKMPGYTNSWKQKRSHLPDHSS